MLIGEKGYPWSYTGTISHLCFIDKLKRMLRKGLVVQSSYKRLLMHSNRVFESPPPKSLALKDKTDARRYVKIKLLHIIFTLTFIFVPKLRPFISHYGRTYSED